MATKTYYFPSSSTSFTLPSGDTLQLRFYHDNATTVNTDLGDTVLKVYPISIPMEQNPTQKTSQYAKTKILLSNIDDGITTSGLPDADDVYLDIYYNGSIKWSGIVLKERTRKIQPHYESGIKYRQVEFTVIDRLYILENKTLSDIGYSANDTIATTIGDMATEIGITGTDIDNYFIITEDTGREYGIIDTGIDGVFVTKNISTSSNAATILKKLAYTFGCFYYTLNDKLYFTSRINSGTSQALDEDDFIDLSTHESDPIQYVKMEDTIDWFIYLQMTDTTNREQTYSKEYGDSGVKSNRQFVLSDETLCGFIGVEPDTGNSTIPNPQDTPDTGGDDYLTDNSIDFHGSGDEVEYGMNLRANYDGVSFYACQAPVTGSPNIRRVEFIDQGVTIDTGKEYYVKRDSFIDSGGASITNPIIPKFAKILDLAASRYNSYFINAEKIKATVNDVKEIHYKYTVNGSTYKPSKNIKIDLVNNKTSFIMTKI